MRNLRYPYSNNERRIHTMTLQEYTQADEILSRSLGVNHPIRKGLGGLIRELREKLG